MRSRNPELPCFTRPPALPALPPKGTTPRIDIGRAKSLPTAATENFIHVIVEDPGHFKTRRTTDFDGKLPAGVSCHYCQRKSGAWDIQSYLFDRGKWTEEKAKAWVGSHKHKQARMIYQTDSEPFELQGKLFLKIPIMPDGQNLHDWGVTPEARARCAQTVLGKPLLGPPTPTIPGNPNVCRTCGPNALHAQPEEGWAEYGRFVDYENNGKTYGIAEITVPDEEVRQAIRERRLNAVSPSVLPKAGFYDDRGLIVTDYNFDHVLFVDRGAFPDLSLAQGGEIAEGRDLDSASWHSALQASFVPSSAPEAKQHVAGYSKSGNPTEKKTKPNSQGERKLGTENTGCTNCEESKKLLDQSLGKIGELQGKLVAAEGSIAAFQKWKDDFVMQGRLEKANRIADLEIKIGTLQAAGKAERVKVLTGIDDVALSSLQASLESVSVVQASLPTPGPKAKFDLTQPIQAAGGMNLVEARRMQMFGYSRDKDGKIAGGLVA
jgi:hypothetical protein